MKNEFENIYEVAEYFELDTVETTSEGNGYPSNLKLALTFDSITRLKEVASALSSKKGYDVSEVELHKKDGWQLWSRSNTPIRLGMYTKANDLNNVAYLNAQSEMLEDAIYQAVVGNDFIDDFDFDDEVSEFDRLFKWMEAKREIMAKWISEIEKYEGDITIFYDVEQNYEIDYIVSDEATGYSYDTHNYQCGLIIDFSNTDEL